MPPLPPEVRSLLAWRRGETPGPARLHVVLTERCNLACRSCFMGSTPPERGDEELDDATLMRVVDEGIALGVEELYLVGGEVFVRRDVTLALAARIKGAGLRGELTTNGTLLDDEVVEQLVAIGWDRLQVSIDGADDAGNDGLRPAPGGGGGTLARIRDGLARLAAARARAGTDLPRVGVSTVVSRDNVDALRGIVHLAAELGADEVTFHALKPMSDDCPAMALTGDDRPRLERAVAEARAEAARAGIGTNAGDLLDPALRDGGLAATLRSDADALEDSVLGAHCALPWTTAVVQFDGRVSPCWEWRGPELGNVRESPLAALWTGEVFTRWREAFAAGEMPDQCASCCLGFVDHLRWLRLETLLAAGEPDAALGLALRLLADQPDHRHAAVARARALLALGREEDAIAWVDDCLAGPFAGRRVERAYLIDALAVGGVGEPALGALAQRVLADGDGDDALSAAVGRLRETLARAGGRSRG